MAALLISGAARAETVHAIRIDGVIDPAVVNFVQTSMDTAVAGESQALLIELDTPGGLVTSTRDIVKIFLDSDLPVVVYVSPKGARAASAGMMITIAGHVAVMAPGTNIGAAHPVIMTQEGDYKSIPKDDIMMEKATNDTVGWVRSICEVRDRNGDWAEKAVTESVSASANEALDANVIDGVVGSRETLINEFLPGREVRLREGETVTLSTKDATVVEIEMSLPQMLQHLINNPNFLYVLTLIGFLGIAIEFKNPGMIFPAVIGVGCILFAMLGPSLSINYAGMMLLLLGFAFLVAEVFVVSYGALTVAGVASLVFGSLMLFEQPEVPEMGPFEMSAIAPSLWVIAAMVLFVLAVLFIFGGAVLRAHRQKVMTGSEEMVGETSPAATDIDKNGGKIFIHGEYWNAFSSSPIAKGDEVVIKSVNGLKCEVEKVSGEAEG